jgi:protein-tyrosine phosphatase
VPYTFPDGWTIFLTSGNGAAHFDNTAFLVNVQLPGYYGPEHDMDRATAQRLKDLAAEMERCHLRRTPIIIHCNHGRTRSPIAVGVYLMVMHGVSAAHALAALRAAFDGSPNRHYGRLGDRVEAALIAFAIFLPHLH